LRRGGANSHHREPPLRCELEAVRTPEQDAAAGDERRRREHRSRQRKRLAHGTQQEHAERHGGREPDQLRPHVGADEAPKGEVAGDEGCGARSEDESDRERRRSVDVRAERSNVDERPRPPRVREQLAQRPAAHARVGEHVPRPLRDDGRGGDGARGDRDRRDGGREQREHDPAEPPARAAEDADERHSDDPRRGLPHQRPRKDARAVLGRRPFRRCGRAGRDDDRDAAPDHDLRDREHGERRRRRTRRGARREQANTDEQQRAERQPPRGAPDSQRCDARGETEYRPKLARAGRRDVQVGGDGGQHRRERNHRRLRREQAREQDGGNGRRAARLVLSARVQARAPRAVRACARREPRRIRRRAVFVVSVSSRSARLLGERSVPTTHTPSWVRRFRSACPVQWSITSLASGRKRTIVLSEQRLWRRRSAYIGTNDELVSFSRMKNDRSCYNS